MAEFATAKTNKFILSEAAVMLGPQADLYNMNIATHGIGLTKNLQFQEETTFTDLTQGSTNQIVSTTKTGSNVTVGFEVYEYTAANMAYAMGLNGAGLSTQTVASTMASALTGTGSEVAFPLTSATGFAQGDYIAADTGSGEVIIRKIVSIATNTITVDKPLAVGQDLASGAKVYVTNFVQAGGFDPSTFMAMKLLTRTTSGDEIAVYIPKVRVTKGLNLSATSSDYSNLPFEVQAFALVSTDSFFSEFGDKLYAASIR